MSRTRRRTHRNRPPRQIPRFKVYKNRPKYNHVHDVIYTGVVIDAVATVLPDGTEVSNGTIFLDELDDIFILQDSIDAFISHNKLKRPVK